MVSNPPYIPVGAVPVDPEVRDHDPAVALYGGSVDGLAIPLAVVGAAAAGCCGPGGVLVMEHADSQGASLPRALRRHGGVGARWPTTPTSRAGHGPPCGAWWRRGPGRSLTGPAAEDSDSVQDEDQQRDDEQHSDDRPDQVGTTHGGQASRVVSVRAVTRARRH